jgi:hypothetical protein
MSHITILYMKSHATNKKILNYINKKMTSCYYGISSDIKKILPQLELTNFLPLVSTETIHTNLQSKYERLHHNP